MYPSVLSVLEFQGGFPDTVSRAAVEWHSNIYGVLPSANFQTWTLSFNNRLFFFAKFDVHTFSKAPNHSDQVRFVDIFCDLLDYSQAEPHNTLLADDNL